MFDDRPVYNLMNELPGDPLPVLPPVVLYLFDSFCGDEDDIRELAIAVFTT